jgi:hypothetical protein|tara:strand:- start:1006 stop:1605 length:600 start_codon:yes stop_codon:yes gene_type:complete
MSKIVKVENIDLINKHREISQRTTPKGQVKSRPDGFDYVDEAYMRNELNKNYPVWSWKPAGEQPVQFLGSEWAIVSGELVVEDEGVVRRFFSPGAARIQFKRNLPHTPENVIDIDKNLASANTNGFKRAINRLCNIADDVYRKQDLSLSEDDVAELAEKMDGLDDGWKNKIMNSVNNGEIIRTDMNAVFRKIEKIKEGE